MRDRARQRQLLRLGGVLPGQVTGAGRAGQTGEHLCHHVRLLRGIRWQMLPGQAGVEKLLVQLRRPTRPEKGNAAISPEEASGPLMALHPPGPHRACESPKAPMRGDCGCPPQVVLAGPSRAAATVRDRSDQPTTGDTKRWVSPVAWPAGQRCALNWDD